MKRFFTCLMLLLALFAVSAKGEDKVSAITYAVYPYLPDPGYYQDIIEQRWAEAEPDIPLIRASWDCYTDSAPEGIDVIMFDAVTLDSLINAGWIQPIGPNTVRDPEDIFPFALERLTVDGRLYGIPVFLCGSFLIYDQDCDAVAAAEHLTDLAGMSEILVVNSEDPLNRPEYITEVMADRQGKANPSTDSSPEEAMCLIDSLAVDAHKHDDDDQVALAYDSGVGQGYIDFSESMRLLKNRLDTARIKSISFSEQPDIRRLYADAAAVTGKAEGQRYEKCLELLNVMTDADVLTALSVQDGAPQYLMLARRTPYRVLSGGFPHYVWLEELAGNENNHVIPTH